MSLRPAISKHDAEHRVSHVFQKSIKIKVLTRHPYLWYDFIQNERLDIEEPYKYE